MNLLILSADQHRVFATLCVFQNAVSRSLLAGEVLVVPGSTLVEMREHDGPTLHRAALAGEDAGAGVAAVIAWLLERNIRVDLVAHRLLRHGPDAFVRVTPNRLAVMAQEPGDEPVLACVRAITQWRTTCPQFLYLTVRPFNAEGVATAIAGAEQQPPACRSNNKVRCENCSAK